LGQSYFVKLEKERLNFQKNIEESQHVIEEGEIIERMLQVERDACRKLQVALKKEEED